MESGEVEQAWQAITAVEAQEALLALKVSAYPHMKREDQESFHRSLHKSAYPYAYEKPVTISIEQMAALING